MYNHGSVLPCSEISKILQKKVRRKWLLGYGQVSSMDVMRACLGYFTWLTGD
jgi:hypothetical protein